jgi:hypothetical protein
MKTMIMIFALSLCSVYANPEGDKFRKSFDAYTKNYVSGIFNSHCELLNVDCNRGRLEILQIVADQARAYKATPEAAATLNGKLADAVIEDNDVEQVVYQRLANGQTADLRKFQSTIGKIVALLTTERDEEFKKDIR